MEKHEDPPLTLPLPSHNDDIIGNPDFEKATQNLASMSTAPSLSLSVHYQDTTLVATTIKTVCFVDQPDTAKAAIDLLLNDDLPIAIDIEGRDLCRSGAVYLIQICNELSLTKCKYVWVWKLVMLKCG